MPWCPKCENEYREEQAVYEFEQEAEGREGLSAEGDLQEELRKEAPKPYIPYKRNADKAEDNRSSAWTLLLVGSVGLLAMILGISGLLPLQIGNPYMFYGVMSAVFLLFIVMGVVSMKNARLFQKKAESENSLRKTLENWCEENLKAEEIDGELAKGEDIALLPPEVLYFRRYERLKEKINHQFMNLDQDFLENLLDEIVYDMVFEK